MLENTLAQHVQQLTQIATANTPQIKVGCFSRDALIKSGFWMTKLTSRESADLGGDGDGGEGGKGDGGTGGEGEGGGGGGDGRGGAGDFGSEGGDGEGGLGEGGLGKGGDGDGEIGGLGDGGLERLEARGNESLKSEIKV